MVHARVNNLYFNDRQGTTAVEFSLLALPFTLCVVSLIELALLFTGGSLLEGAVQDAGRLVKTGQLQQSDADPEEAFRTALCDHAGVLLDCDDLQYNVETLAAFTEAENEPELDDEGNMEEPTFEPGGSNEIVLIRVTYLYPLMTPGIGAYFADYPNNKKLLMSTVVLQTEPYEFNEDDFE